MWAHPAAGPHKGEHVNRDSITPKEKPTIIPKVYAGTSRPMKATDVRKNGIFPGLHMHTPWADWDSGCQCGRGGANPVMHARWCEVRADWSWGDE